MKRIGRRRGGDGGGLAAHVADQTHTSTHEEGVDLPGFVLDREHLLLWEVYRDFTHNNKKLRLDGGCRRRRVSALLARSGRAMDQLVYHAPKCCGAMLYSDTCGEMMGGPGVTPYTVINRYKTSSSVNRYNLLKQLQTVTN